MAKFSRNALMNSYIPQTQNYITILIIYPRKTNNKRIFHFVSQLNLVFRKTRNPSITSGQKINQGTAVPSFPRDLISFNGKEKSKCGTSRRFIKPFREGVVKIKAYN